MVEVLAEAKDMEEYRSKIPKILDLLLEYHLLLKDGRARQEDLVIGKTISREPNEYKVDSLTAIAAQQLEDVGILIHPGEKIRYMIKDAQSKEKDERVRPFPLVGPDDTYDAKEYQKILLKATEELLIHFGYDVKSLEAIVNPPSSPIVKRKKTTLPHLNFPSLSISKIPLSLDGRGRGVRAGPRCHVRGLLEDTLPVPESNSFAEYVAVH